MMIPIETQQLEPQVILQCPRCMAWLSINLQSSTSNLSNSLKQLLAGQSQMQISNLQVNCASCNATLDMKPLPNYKVAVPDLLLLDVQQSKVFSVKVLSMNANQQSIDDEPQRNSSNIERHVKPTKRKDYYEVLGFGVDHAAVTQPEIKKAYHKLALQFHPDKVAASADGTQTNDEMFKLVCEAYSVLGDVDKRQQYDRFVKLGGLDGGAFGGGDEQSAAEAQAMAAMANPEQLFRGMFGGDRFVDLIGEVSIAREFGNAMFEAQQQQQQQQEEGSGKTGRDSEQKVAASKERERRREERIRVLAGNLLHLLSHYTEHPLQRQTVPGVVSPPEAKRAMLALDQEFSERIKIQTDELRYESYGTELLHAIGYMYSLRANAYLAKEETFMGIGKVFADFKERGHFISSTFGTIRAAVQLQSTLTKLQISDDNAQNDDGQQQQQQQQQQDAQTSNYQNLKPRTKVGASAPKLTAEQRQNLEQQAATKGMDALWRGTKMEIQSVIRDVCDSILNAKEISVQSLSEATADLPRDIVVSEVLKRRARALAVVGRVYESAVKPPAAAAEQ